MAKTSLIVKTKRKHEEARQALAAGRDVEKPTQLYNRCGKCGRVRAYMRKFDLCRICFRELAREGKIMGVTKSSW